MFLLTGTKNLNEKTKRYLFAENIANQLTGSQSIDIDTGQLTVSIGRQK